MVKTIVPSSLEDQKTAVDFLLSVYVHLRCLSVLVIVFWNIRFFFPQSKDVRLDKCVYREQDQMCMIVPRGAKIEVAGVDQAIRISLVS